ncbi:hypothetical protein V8E53_010062 [Lactarius tabidus]
MPPQTSRSKTRGASGPPSRRAPSGGPEGSPGNFMLQVPSPVVTTSGTATLVLTGPSMPAVVSEPLPTHTPEQPSEEAMPPLQDIPKRPPSSFGTFLENMPLSQCVYPVNPSPMPQPRPSSKDTEAVTAVEHDDEHADGDSESNTDNDNDNNHEDTDDVQIIDAIVPPDRPAESCNAVPPGATVNALTMAAMNTQLVHMEHHIGKLKRALNSLRGKLAEAHRHNHQQNNHLHKVDIHIEHIVDNYLDILPM